MKQSTYFAAEIVSQLQRCDALAVGYGYAAAQARAESQMGVRVVGWSGGVCAPVVSTREHVLIAEDFWRAVTDADMDTGHHRTPSRDPHGPRAGQRPCQECVLPPCAHAVLL